MSQSDTSKQSASQILDGACRNARDLQIAGHLDLAERLYRSVLQAEPRHAAANHGVGQLHVRSHRPSDGLPHLLIALEAEPESHAYWVGYLEGLLAAGNVADAKVALSLGREHGLAGAAVDDFSRRLDAASPPPAKHSSPPRTASAKLRNDPRGARQQEQKLFALVTKRRFADALVMARTITERFPERGAAWKTLGALSWPDHKDEAVAAMRQSVALRPRDVEAHRNLALTLARMNLFDEAEACLRSALRIAHESAPIHSQLGDLFCLQDRMHEAIDCFRRSISLQATDGSVTSEAHIALLFLLSQTLTDPDALFAEHCRFAAIFEEPLRKAWPRHSNSRDPGRCLQVGVVSGDFFNHAIVSFFEPVLAALQNVPNLKLHAYYNNVIVDESTERMREYFHGWQGVAEWSDAQLAKKIMDDRIDILIDLSGHTAKNRLMVFARKPAPIQISWIGYPGTTGLRAMDYYLTDRHWLPPGQFDRHFTEKLLYLPATAPFQLHAAAQPVNPLPALTSGHLTFGSFNRFSKISASTILLWSGLLRALPSATMLIGGIALDSQRQALIEQFAAHGIVRERLTFRPRSGMDSYLALHHQVDICLDSTPYGGGTTTQNAVWMGVPTLTVAGNTPPGRQCAGLMGHLGLEQFIATDAADFAAKGVYWAAHLNELAELRAGLRERCAHSPAQQPEAIVAALERTLRHVWRRWCTGQTPESFDITAPPACK
jgi:predicted O-linked N-acetylglucosamine transferase (SPINDLY family)